MGNRYFASKTLTAICCTVWVLLGCAQQPSSLESPDTTPAFGSDTRLRETPGVPAGDTRLPHLRPDPDPTRGKQRGDFASSGAPVPVSSPATATSVNNPFANSGTASLRRGDLATGESQGASGIVLGEGDEIQFSMFGQSEMQTNALVSSRGTVSLPLIGDTQVGGLTPGRAEQKIADAYRAGGFFKNPQVNVTLETYRSQQISVLGEVNLPGRYPLDTETTVLDALALAEGVKPTGARKITIIRKSTGRSESIQVDLDRLVADAAGLTALTLAAGDIVYVPEAELFYIYGEVRRPDAYAIKPGITVMQALSLGGGLTDKGSNSRIEIQRKVPDGLRTIKPELSDRVEPDDVIYVKERFF